MPVQKKSGNLLNTPYIYIYYSVQLNRGREIFRQDKKSFKYEHLNFPGQELNVTDITEQ